MLRRFLPYLLILLALASLKTNALAQSNCPGMNYLGVGVRVYPNSTTFSASFPSDGSYGSASFSGTIEVDTDAVFQTCNPNTWNAQAAGYYGTVTYNDGTINYSGAARFWFDLAPASTPLCTDNGKTYTHMVRRLKIQSCSSSSHVLSNRFIAVSCDGSYCEDVSGTPCSTSGWFSFNSINLTVSGF